MQEAGTVLHLARSGRLIIKAAATVSDNTILVDENGRRACKVMEMIGPVSSPFLSAQPLTDRIERMVGKKLFVGEARRFHDKREEYRSRVREQKSRSTNPHRK